MAVRSEELWRQAVRLDDAEAGLRAVVALRSHLDRLEAEHVANAVRSGLSWSGVARLLGVSRQAAHKRFSARVREETAGASSKPREQATEQARLAVRLAAEEAAAMGHASTGPEHLLLALLRDDEGKVVLALEEHGVHYSAARREVRRLYGEADGGDELSRPGARAPLSSRAREALDRAVREARRAGEPAGVEHILGALLDDEQGGAVRALAHLGVDLPALDATLRRPVAAASA